MSSTPTKRLFPQPQKSTPVIKPKDHESPRILPHFHHIQQSCFLTSAFSMFTGCQDIKTFLELHTDEFKVQQLHRLLFNTFETKEDQQTEVTIFAAEQGLNISSFGDVEKSIYAIQSIIHTSVPKEVMFISINTDDTFELQIQEYRPTYFVIDVQSYNATHNPEELRTYAPRDIEIGDLQYDLSSLVVHYSGHFIAVHFNEGKMILRDDTYHTDRTFEGVASYLRSLGITSFTEYFGCYTKK